MFERKKPTWFLILLFVVPIISYPQVSFEEAFSDISFEFPVEILPSNDGTNRLFVVEQPGKIKVFQNISTVQSSEVDTFLDLTSRVTYSSGQEIGLLGLAFHPDYANNGYLYVYFTDRPSNYRLNVARFQVSSSNPNFVDPNTEILIASFTKNQTESNHNGGKIAFGPDGYLYISVGDGGGGGDPQRNGQNLNTVFGSILRIDIDVNGDNPVEDNPELPNGNYEIPSDNPRVGESGLDELYAWGIRNTWKFSFDAQGRFWGGDVGQGGFEEINLIERGGNYGWNKFEAESQPSYGSSTVLATTPDIKPLYFYNRNNGDRSITGGYVYRGGLTDPLLTNRYVFGDFSTGRVWSLSYNSSNGNTTVDLLFRASGINISSFGEDTSGELYFSNYAPSGKIYRLTSQSSGPRTITVDGIGDWDMLSSGTNGTVETLTVDDSGLVYVGGAFSEAGGLSTPNIATYDRNSGWSAFSTGTNGTVFTIEIAPDGKIYVGGNFSTINGIAANNIAVWDRVDWQPLGSGTNGPVSKIRINGNGTLFAGGVFTNAGGVVVNNIAQWENNQWTALVDQSSSIAGTNNEIRSIEIGANNELYVGGNFDLAGGNSANRIAVWNGTNWGALGSGTSGFVQAIKATTDYVYAAGNFVVAGGQTANRISRWNITTNQWEGLGDGLSGNVNALAYDGTFIYACGTFETASDGGNENKIVENIARWSQSSGWQALGPNTTVGVDNRCNALAFKSDFKELYAGGNFLNAGQESTNSIAVWGENLCKEDSVIPEYRINGVWQSGLNQLTLEENNALTISMLPNNVSFTITLPDGSTNSGDLNLGLLTTQQSGTYVITTQNDCVEEFELIVTSVDADGDGDGVMDGDDQCPNTPNGESVNNEGCSDSQLDDDNDGVFNADDLCPNTGPENNVDTNGCKLVELSPNNFIISVTSVSCRNTTDGQINIEAVENRPYTATLTSVSLSETQSFEENLVFDNLANATYELCITVDGLTDYEVCYTIVIEAPEALAVFSQFDVNQEVVKLTMTGATTFNIVFNDQNFSVNTGEIELQLKDGENRISVTTDKSCQGSYEERIFYRGTTKFFPNPVSNMIHVIPKNGVYDRLDIRLYNMLGQLIIDEKADVQNQDLIEISAENLTPGLYFLHVSYNNKATEIYKLQKQ